MSYEVRDARGGNWFWLHNDIIDRFGPQLGAYGFAIYGVLCRHASREQTTRVSQRRIAEELACSDRQVIREIQRLEELGLLRVEAVFDGGGQRSNRYVLLPLPASTTGDTQSPPGEPQSPGGRHTVTGGVTVVHPMEQDLDEQDLGEQEPMIPDGIMGARAAPAGAGAVQPTLTGEQSPPAMPTPASGSSAARRLPKGTSAAAFTCVDHWQGLTKLPLPDEHARVREARVCAALLDATGKEGPDALDEALLYLTWAWRGGKKTLRFAVQDYTPNWRSVKKGKGDGHGAGGRGRWQPEYTPQQREYLDEFAQAVARGDLSD